jgi:site-specific DNA recombinase
VLVGLRGLVGQLYREDNAHKVRRGQAGRVGQGLAAGGLTYGYPPVPGDKGKRIIVETEADSVRRIFEEYVAGRTPRDIAHDLNKEGVPPPRGRVWNASTINGNPQRGIGILHNELYAGRLVWNKVRMVKDPDSGKRLSRPNAKVDWQSTEVPDLAIIPRALFEAAQARKIARSRTHPNQQRRPRHMLSGLLRCGACRAGMSTNGKDRSGRIRIRCSAATESGSCNDARTFYLSTVETAVLSGLTAELRQPRVIAEYVRTYHEERVKLAAGSKAKARRLERRLGEINRELERVIDGIAKGTGDPVLLGRRTFQPGGESRKIEADLKSQPPNADVIALHPSVLARYEQQLADLKDTLSKGICGGDSEATEAIREVP